MITLSSGKDTGIGVSSEEQYDVGKVLDQSRHGYGHRIVIYECGESFNFWRV